VLQHLGVTDIFWIREEICWVGNVLKEKRRIMNGRFFGNLASPDRMFTIPNPFHSTRIFGLPEVPGELDTVRLHWWAKSKIMIPILVIKLITRETADNIESAQKLRDHDTLNRYRANSCLNTAQLRLFILVLEYSFQPGYWDPGKAPSRILHDATYFCPQEIRMNTVMRTRVSCSFGLVQSWSPRLHFATRKRCVLISLD
jgi:hypothetical protein